MATAATPSTNTSGGSSGRGGSESGGRGAGGRGRRGGQQGGNPRGANHDGSQQQNNANGDRSRGRGGGGKSRGRGGGGGGGGGRGGGRGNNSTAVTADGQPPTGNHPPPQPGGGGVSGSRPTEDAASSTTPGAGAAAAAAEAIDDDAEVCFICASPVAHHSVAPCNHRTCHICALRLRALYKTKACAHCRTEAATVIFTDDAEKRFEEFGAPDFFRTDANLGISYEKPEIFEDTVLLLRYNCPDADCDVACLGWRDLHAHVKSRHQKVLCDLCTRNKKVFTHEHELFTKEELRRHEKFGDDNPGAIDQSGFKGHPECGFCRQRFYGDDELYSHCREKHERCHLCDRRRGGQNPQYFLNYDALEQHFSKEHFPCYDKECQEKKFVVFDSEMDLKAHQLEQHPNGLSKDARRDARRVDISAFDYRPVYQEPTRRERRGGGRGRDPNAEPMVPTGPAHQSRAEIAHQREREIHGTQAQTSRSFGGSLTRSDPPTQSVARPSQPAAATQPAPIAVAPEPARGPETPQEQARRLRHAAVTERAATLLRQDASKLEIFRARISSYRQGTLSATELINAFFALFDCPSDALGKLVKELAEIFEAPAKRDALLRAWGDWKAINEDYPSLPGAAGPSSSATGGIPGAGVGGSRVLRLKNSTAQSSRSAVSRHGSWGSATASTPANPFPSLPTRGKAPAGAAPTPHWTTSARPSAAPSASSSARASPAIRPAGTTPAVAPPPPPSGRREELFPALPAAAKPSVTLFSPGSRGVGVIRNHSGGAAVVNPWGGSNAAGGSSSAAAAAGGEGDVGTEGAGKRKGNKGKKQVLIW